jgi:hypothetical protein
MSKINIKNKNGFDEDKYNMEVISTLFSKLNQNKKEKENDKFNKWIRDNEEHLEEMYNLSGLKCGHELFYNYVYNNSI